MPRMRLESFVAFNIMLSLEPLCPPVQCCLIVEVVTAMQLAIIGLLGLFVIRKLGVDAGWQSGSWIRKVESVLTSSS